VPGLSHVLVCLNTAAGEPGRALPEKGSEALFEQLKAM
jgi:hypothetical protein